MDCSRWLVVMIGVLLVKCCTCTDPIQVSGLQDEYSVPENMTLQICLNLTITNATYNGNYSINITTNPADAEGTDLLLDYDDSEIELEDDMVTEFCVSVMAYDDMIAESNESFVISFDIASVDAPAMSYTASTIVTIIDNDVIEVTVNQSVTVLEGTSYQFCAEFTIEYDFVFNIEVTITDGNTDGSDYSFITPTTLTFRSPNNLLCVSIAILDNDNAEPEEYFIINWIAPNASNVIITPAVTNVTIERQVEVSLANVTDVTISEETGMVRVCLQVNTPPLSTVDIGYNITFGTADTTDITVQYPGTINITTDELYGCLSIMINSDSIVEDTESFTVVFSVSINGATYSGNNEITIYIEDSSAAIVGFGIASVSVQDNVGTYSTTLENVMGMVDVNFYVAVMAKNGSAVAGSDFILNSTNAMIPWTLSPPTIEVSIIDDNIVEQNETFMITLSVINNTRITTSISELKITIVDNDKSGLSTPSSMEITESQSSVQLCFSPSTQIAPKSDGSDYTLNYTTMNGNATDGQDFIGVSATVDIPSLSTNETCISISINDDSITEENRLFLVQWTLEDDIPSGVTLDNGVTTVTIVDDDDIEPSTSSSSTPPTTSTTQTSSPTQTSTTDSFPLGTYAIIGIIVGVVAAGVCFLLVLIFIICCIRVRTNRRGFYVTNEDKGDAPQMLRYSASLRSLTSQTVMPVDSREKENEYMV